MNDYLHEAFRQKVLMIDHLHEAFRQKARLNRGQEDIMQRNIHMGRKGRRARRLCRNMVRFAFS